MNAIERAAKEIAETMGYGIHSRAKFAIEKVADILRKHFEPAERADQWQPIATAPKDGGTLLLFRKYVCTGYWSSRYERWFACVDSQTINPTHWRPLPLPPQEEQASG